MRAVRHEQLLRLERRRAVGGHQVRIHHYANIERIAMVGKKKWQHGMATFCKPFTNATVRHCKHADAAEAKKWLAKA
ncbi:STAS/SEC14 domain-containing protein [Nitrospira sp. MA-1]|nr:STAS/SEC14 domain-containing protein [Nitrospira sp. MA-1]